jgi:SAM-dependent methyltransferase
VDDREVGRYWDENAVAWTCLARQGYDVYRDLLNTPAFFALLPDVRELQGLDLGCGEGHNTRLLATRGASMSAIDVSRIFIGYAQEEEIRQPRGIRYAIASAQNLPFPEESFDFATAFMSLMDMPEPEAALREAWRVLRTGGFFQFSVTHPCFDTPHRKQVRDGDGNTVALEVGGYFERDPGQIDEWLFSAAPEEAKLGLRPFRIPRFRHTVAEWLNGSIDAGFLVERVAEPRPDAETAARFPVVADARVAPYYLHMRCRKHG